MDLNEEREWVEFFQIRAEEQAEHQRELEKRLKR